MKNMKVVIYFTGLIDVKNIANGSSISIPEKTNLDAFLSLLGIKQHHKKYLIVLVNEKQERLDYVLRDLDIVKLFLPVGGG